ncbi:unnamed protein product [Rangifer tarandus platyrhynchus]|uniref:Uncharacterized protein n=2 Tax=Rangifer tarandus platyrhynchus TaxID=3082113 RepID=A0ABN8ZJT6_RANTA|nr:unnamed protein product [Rangifer tarandus platyrhynchus]CAI9709168.1 unnamed protein product [Rangifer tarandus platyrhynchus]
MPTGVLPQRSEEPGSIPGKKSSRPSRRKFGAGAGTHTLAAARWSPTLSSRLSQPGGGGSAGRRGRERRWEVRPAPQGAGRTLGRPSQVSTKSGGVEERSPRLREEVDGKNQAPQWGVSLTRGCGGWARRCNRGGERGESWGRIREMGENHPGAGTAQ